MNGADDLKKMAKAAKSRMKSGFWNRVKEQRNSVPESERMSYASYVKRELARERKPDAGEEEFTRKVAELVNSGEVVVNPIGRLMDKDYYESLDYAAKQRYILELTDKYRTVAATIVKK